MVEATKPANVSDELTELKVDDTQFHEKIKPKPISPFIKPDKSWEDEELGIPKEIIKGIVEELGWDRPSRIQNTAIPIISQLDEESKQYENLIAQARNGAGKSGAFIIGSLMRVDPAIEGLQVIVVGHTRELVNQLTTVFQKAVRFAPQYRVCNLAQDKFDPKAQIIVSTFGQILNNLAERSKANKMDLSKLRVFVLDEADSFFNDEKQKQVLYQFIDTLEKLKNKVQFVFFSATYDDAVSEAISNIVQDACQIVIKVEELKLENVHQFYFKCKPKGKMDFVMDLFEAFEKNTQTIIFVNTLQFAEIVHRVLNDKGYRASIIFGKMTKEERDEYIEKFRRGEISVIITTNLLARGFDMREIKLVINFDVPQQQGKPDFENYIHRIGRSGRFGDVGLALTLFDREEDENCFWKIIEHYKMQSKVKKLEGGAKQLEQLIHKAKEGADAFE